MKSEPKFKVGDKILYVGDGSFPQEYCIKIRTHDGIIKKILSSGGYEIIWYYPNTNKIDKETTKKYGIYSTTSIDAEFIIYDSPEGIWLRL